MSEDFYIFTASESAARADLLPAHPSENVSHLLGNIQPLGEPEEVDDYGSSEETEWVIDVGWKDAIPLEAQMLADLLSNAEWRENDRPTLYGKDAATGKWTCLISADGPAEVTALQVSWPYFAGWMELPSSTDCDLFEERLDAVQKASSNLIDSVIRTAIDPVSAAKRATHYANLHDRFEGDVLLRLKASILRKFEGKKIWDVMLCLGLKWGDMDCFHLENQSPYGHDHHFSVSTSTEPGYFLPEEVAAGKVKTKDLLFHFSLPRSANPEQVFNAMFAAAQYAQSRLGGVIESADGRTAEKESLLIAIRNDVEELRAEGFIPGSGPALRLF